MKKKQIDEEKSKKGQGARAFKGLGKSEGYICSQCKSKSEEKLKTCSGCGKAWYCEKKCQRAHWAKHKLLCKISNPSKPVEAVQKPWEMTESTKLQLLGTYQQTLGLINSGYFSLYTEEYFFVYEKNNQRIMAVDRRTLEERKVTEPAFGNPFDINITVGQKTLVVWQQSEEPKILINFYSMETFEPTGCVDNVINIIDRLFPDKRNRKNYVVTATAVNNSFLALTTCHMISVNECNILLLLFDLETATCVGYVEIQSVNSDSLKVLMVPNMHMNEEHIVLVTLTASPVIDLDIYRIEDILHGRAQKYGGPPVLAVVHDLLRVEKSHIGLQHDLYGHVYKKVAFFVNRQGPQEGSLSVACTELEPLGLENLGLFDDPSKIAESPPPGLCELQHRQFGIKSCLMLKDLGLSEWKKDRCLIKPISWYDGALFVSVSNPAVSSIVTVRIYCSKAPFNTWTHLDEIECGNSSEEEDRWRILGVDRLGMISFKRRAIKNVERTEYMCTFRSYGFIANS